MMNNFMNSKLPDIYVRSGKKCYLDPVRKKLIFITPEETVRQHLIAGLLYDLNVPIDMIRVEERLSHYNIKSKKRADIIIEMYDKKQDVIMPLAVIECKAPHVLLGEKAIEQVIGYADELCCDYAMITDGNITYTYKYIEEQKKYQIIESLPEYICMLKQEFVPCIMSEMPKRIEFDDIPNRVEEYVGYDIGKSTIKPMKEIMVNFWEALLYCDHMLPCKQYKLFKVIRDYGVRMLSYGNNSGASFDGPYRSFLIEYNESTEFVSLAVSTYMTSVKSDYVKTAINVAIDNEKNAHHALQLVVDDNVQINGNVCDFYHHGRIGVSNIGTGKVSELKTFVEAELPELIMDKRFYMGRLTNDRLWNLDDPEMEKLVVNLISYALIRDKYRAWLIANKKREK